MALAMAKPALQHNSGSPSHSCWGPEAPKTTKQGVFEAFSQSQVMPVRGKVYLLAPRTLRPGYLLYNNGAMSLSRYSR